MADNNYDPQEVGGLQPIYCPQCGGEVAKLDSYQLSKDNKRYHYPECWQRYELSMPATGMAKAAPMPEKPAVIANPEVELTESHKPWSSAKKK